MYAECTLKFLTVLSAMFFLSTSPMLLANTSQKIYLSTKGWSPLIQEYFNLITEKSLEHSQATHGNYEYKHLSERISYPRAVRNSRQDSALLITFASGPIPEIQQYKIPILNGFLGLRELIINQSDLSKFIGLFSKEDFTSLSVGQVSAWHDAENYRNANIRVHAGPNFESLFPMLAAGRFDYLPLSLLEADNTLGSRTELSGKLTILKDMYVYYPAPMYLNIQEGQEELGKRVFYGLRKMADSGELSTLFRSYFSKYIEKISPDQAQVMVLLNPTLTPEENSHYISQTIGEFFSQKTSIQYLQ